MSNSVKDIFQVENSELMSVCGPAVEQFQSPMHMNELAMACSSAFDRGFEGAYFVPATDFAIGIALRVCRLPTVRDRWPDELFDRVDTAAYIAGQVAANAASQGLLVRAYRRNHHLKALADPVYVGDLSKVTHMQSLCESLFFDGVVSIGGAALKSQNQFGTPFSEAIDPTADSRSIPLFAQVRRSETDRVKRFLGRPYARGDAFEYDGQHSTIEFTEDTIGYLRRYTADANGCPAVNIRLDSGDSIYAVRWREMVSTLLSKNVKISRNYKETKSRRAKPYNILFR